MVVAVIKLFDTMKITDVLRAEHAVFHNLFDHIETVVPPRQQALVDRHHDVLGVDETDVPALESRGIAVAPSARRGQLGVSITGAF